MLLHASLGAVLLFVCVLAQPRILAHADGFTVYGVELPEVKARNQCMGLVQDWVSAVASTTSYYAFLVGKYIGGARLFTAPVDFAPAPGEVVRTPTQRRRRAAAGASFIWCTLAALTGTPVSDAATRAVAGVTAFIKPTNVLASAPSAEGLSIFRVGAAPAVSLLRRPLLENEASPPRWAALSAMAHADKLIISALTSAIATSDRLLSGWAERVVSPRLTSAACLMAHSRRVAEGFRDTRDTSVRARCV